MMISLLNKATWKGKSHKSGSTHDVDVKLASKLISRGYAEVYVEPKEDEDGAAADK